MSRKRIYPKVEDATCYICGTPFRRLLLSWDDTRWRAYCSKLCRSKSHSRSRTKAEDVIREREGRKKIEDIPSPSAYEEELWK